MRTNLYVAVLSAGIILSGCSKQIETVTVYQQCNCPLPVAAVPQVSHTNGIVSFDGKKFAYLLNDGGQEFFILDLQSLDVEKINIGDVLPDTASWDGIPDCGEILWSPYSPNKLLLHCVGFVKTTGNKNRQNIYIYDLASKKAIRVTPSVYGPLGSAEGIGVVAWLKGSQDGFDSLFTGMGIYVPQQDSFYTTPPAYLVGIYQSPHTMDNVTVSFDQNAGPRYFINSYLFTNSASIGTAGGADHISWSPDGSKIAFSVWPNTPGVSDKELQNFEQVWIVYKGLVPSGAPNAYTLNFQDLFCTYTYWGLHAEYVTDSTLVVSMYKDGDNIAPLWEITDKGKIVRQLTH